MECASCEAILDELRRGDLPARIEAEARSHLAQCPRCRAAHMRLLRVDAESSAPPRPVAQSTSLRAGRALLRVFRSESKSDRAEAIGRSGAERGLVGRLAMAPQVAMGSVMLLIVLVGLFSLPQLTRRHAERFRASLGSQRVDRPKPETDTSAASSNVAPTEVANPDADARAAAERERNAHGKALPPSAAKGSGSHKDPHAASKTGPQADLANAMQLYNAHEYAQATPLFSHALLSRTSGADEATALLYLARAERAQGHCDRAVNSYDALVRTHPKRPEAKDALHEAIACYDRLSQPGRVWRILEQAAQTQELGPLARSISAQRAGSSSRKAATGQTGVARSD